MLKTTVHIPDFPFQDRKTELDILKEFCSESWCGESRVLLLEGPSGIGKSRLIKRLRNRIKDNVFWVQPMATRAERGAAGDLIEQLLCDVTRLRLRKSPQYFFKKATSLAGNTVLALRKFAPTLALSAPILGPAAEHITKEVMLKDLAKLERSEKKRTEMLLGWLDLAAEERYVIVVIEDIHELDDTEQRHLANIVPLACSNPDSRTRFIFVGRPLDSLGRNVVRSLIMQMGRNAMISRIDLEPLKSPELQRICDNIFTNAEKCEGLVQIAAGNPQALLEGLARINLQGGIRKLGELIALDVERDGAAEFIGNDIWASLEREPKARRLLGILAVNASPVDKKRLDLIQAAAGLEASEIGLLVSDLCDTKLLEWVDVRQVRGSVKLLRFCHSSIRLQIAARLRHDSPFTYSECNRICALYLESLLQERAPGLIAVVKSLVDLDREIPPRSMDHLMDLICLANNLRESGSADWESCSFGCARVCSANLFDADAIDLSTAVLHSWQEVLRRNSKNWNWLVSALVRAHYRLGQYEECVALRKSAGDLSIESAYYIATAETLAKIDEGYLSRVQEIVAEHKSSDSSDSTFASLLVSTEALALQETGFFFEADKVYGDYLHQMENAGRDSLQFRIISPLFLNPHAALESCKRVKSSFLKSKDRRLAGMAANNMGYCLLGLSEYVEALAEFELSVALLSQWPHESVFPLNNAAFVHILMGRFADAYNLLKKGLFARMSPYHEVAVQINLSYCRWGMDLDSDLSPLDSIFYSSGLASSSWLEWQVAYLKSFVELHSQEGAEKSEACAVHCEKLRNLECSDAVAPYWNGLVKALLGPVESDQLLLPTGKPPSAMAAISTDSIVRPSALCFGHI